MFININPGLLINNLLTFFLTLWAFVLISNKTLGVPPWLFEREQGTTNKCSKSWQQTEPGGSLEPALWGSHISTLRLGLLGSIPPCWALPAPGGMGKLQQWSRAGLCCPWSFAAPQGAQHHCWGSSDTQKALCLFTFRERLQTEVGEMSEYSQEESKIRIIKSASEKV